MAMNPFDAKLYQCQVQGLQVDVFGEPIGEVVTEAARGKTIVITDQVRARDLAAMQERDARISKTWSREVVRRG